MIDKQRKSRGLPKAQTQPTTCAKPLDPDHHLQNMSSQARDRPPVPGLYPPSSRYPRVPVENAQDDDDWDDTSEESGLSGYSSPDSDYFDDLPPWALFFYDDTVTENFKFPLSENVESVNPHNFWPQIKWNAQLKGKQIRELIKRDPVVALRFWRELYHERRPGNENDNFLCWRMAKFFSQVVTSSERSSKATSNLYCDLLAEGLYPFLEEVVSDPAFFRESPLFAFFVLDVIQDAGLVCHTQSWAVKPRHKGYATVPQIQRVIAALCKTAWADRPALVNAEGDLKEQRVMKKRIRATLGLSLLHYYWLHAPGETPFDSDDDYAVLRIPGFEDIRRMFAFTWFIRDNSAPWTLESLYDCLQAYAYGTGVTDGELATFVRDDVAGICGAEAWLKRLARTLEEPRLLSGSLGNVLAVTNKLFMKPEFFRHYHSSGVLKGLRAAVDRLVSQGKPDDGLYCRCALEVLQIYTTVSTDVPASEGLSPTVRNYDCLELLARAVQLAPSVGDYTPTEVATAICTHYEAFGVTFNLLAEKNVLGKAMKQALRRQWYPTLRAIRPYSKQSADLKTLSKTWYSLGSSLGLDEKEERVEYERETKRLGQLCAWKECQYHTVKPATPLSACKGCGEARYCGRACQVLDWKNGHKLVCKRLKDTAHTPKK
ncbi:hypothetical protein PENSPDRAFT_96114 [Peniophora sp. CONT]|nr:hypothetical protein PENSPDRAFT_96114 [Peniophora sp. CONT]